MNPSIPPEELRQIVEEVYQRVKSALATGSPQQATPGQASALAASAAQKPAACTLAHGVAARPPETSERLLPVPAAGSPAAALVEAGACRIGHCAEGEAPAPPLPPCDDLAPYLDHTLLKPTATDAQVTQLCEEARRHHFATVCVHSAHVPLCASLLEGSGVMVCTVVGFPLGAMSTEAKAFETRDAVAKGAGEVDMVIHVGKLQQGDYAYVYHDIEAVVKAAHTVPVKVILETAFLTDEQKIIACALSKAAGAHFVKTSTGFGPGGATPEDIALMRRVVGPEMGVKASGGIRDCPTAQKMVAAGASRIGASASVAIIRGAKTSS